MADEVDFSENMVSFLIALTLAAAASGGTHDPAVGLWTNPKGSLTVRTRRCGPQLCATVVSASEKAKLKAARGGVQQLVGTEIFSNYKPDGDGSWAGTLFVPDKGKRVSSTLEPVGGGDRVTISGCLIGRILCKSQVWTRADSRLAKR